MPTMPTILIRGGAIIGPDGSRVTDILIRDGVITSIKPIIAEAADEVIDAKDHLIFPGLIDCHVHFREPGLEHKATMLSESRAALAGGITTVCEMPNTIPPTVTIAALADKVRRAEAIADCDIRFFFGITQAVHLHALSELWTSGAAEMKRLKARCCGLKLFLDHSTGNQGIDADILDDVFKTCAALRIPVVAHCEDPEMNAQAAATVTSRDISAHSAMRPAASEDKAVERAIALAAAHGTHLHIAHLSTALAVKRVREAKAAGVPVTCEVTPHHLLLSTDAYTTLGARAKVNPPLRTKEDQAALWEAIADGTVDCISTDHAPHTIEEKSAADPLNAPSGMTGVETMVPLLLTVASGGLRGKDMNGKESRIKNRELRMEDIHRLCFANPNRIFGLGKQGIIEGVQADLVLIDPKKQWMITGSALHSKCGWTPFEGWKVTGSVARVIRTA